MSGKTSTILVSGANGFLGCELIGQLLKVGNYNVIAMTSKREALLSKFESVSQLRVIDTYNWSKQIEKNSKIDLLINCAFPRLSDPEQLAKGVLFTENLIKDSIRLDVKRIINISSQSVYSQKSKASVDENAAIVPESIYGMAKFASERIVETLCQNSSKNIHYSNIRLASLTGYGLEVRITNKFVKKVLEGQPIIINGGNQVISYLDVRDAASAIIAMFESNSNEWNPIYNLGNYSHCTLLELAEIIRDTSKEYIVDDMKLEIIEGLNDFNNLLNSESFYRAFDWRPKYTIPLMVKDLFEYYKA
jgi:nucleoside-diphosphate-sugar epimerase